MSRPVVNPSGTVRQDSEAHLAQFPAEFAREESRPWKVFARCAISRLRHCPSGYVLHGRESGLGRLKESCSCVPAEALRWQGSAAGRVLRGADSAGRHTGEGRVA